MLKTQHIVIAIFALLVALAIIGLVTFSALTSAVESATEIVSTSHDILNPAH